jgi:hypothetical protein
MDLAPATRSLLLHQASSHRDGCGGGGVALQGAGAGAHKYGRRGLAAAEACSHLAAALRAQGKLAEAEALYKRAARVQEQALGRTHPALAASMNTIGMLLKGSGRRVPLPRRAAKRSSGGIHRTGTRR